MKVQFANALGVVQWTVPSYYTSFVMSQSSTNLQSFGGGYTGINIPTPPSAIAALIVNNLPGSVAIRIVGGGIVTGGIIEPAWETNNRTTGAQAAAFTPVANKPGFNATTPTKWLPVLSNGVTYFIPCFL
jgi:hypothetical protein